MLVRLFRKLGPYVRKHQHILNNLSVAFPELGQEEREKLAVASWGNFGAVLAEYPFLDKMVTSGAEARNQVEICDARTGLPEVGVEMSV